MSEATQISVYPEPCLAKPQVGAKILDLPAFVKAVEREIQETGTAQNFDGTVAGSIYIQLRPDTMPLVTGEYGLMSEDQADFIQIGEVTYLRRSRVFPALGCHALVTTVEEHWQLERSANEQDGTDNPLTEFPPGTTHVLIGISVADEGTERGNPPWARQVADEGAE